MRGTVLLAVVGVVGLAALPARGNAFIKGAYYRLGEDDPGAAAGQPGNATSIDSFTDHLDLTRLTGANPTYSADTPSRYPLSTLSMNFTAPVTDPPVSIAGYLHSPALEMIQQGYALEMWVKGGALSPGNFVVIAYNGNPDTDGFGFVDHDGKYFLRMGSDSKAVPGPFERELGADDSKWHHLAYVQSFGNSSYYYDGKLVTETTADPTPLAATGSFLVGGFGFSGNIDEIRYQSFNPIAAGAFDPTNFLIVPEPGIMGMMGVGGVGLLLRRRRS